MQGSGEGSGFDALTNQATIFAYIGIGAFAISWAQTSIMATFAENIVYKTHIVYFKKALEKDAAFYDE